MMDVEHSSTSFCIFITGQIVSAHFPLGPDAVDIFCRFEWIIGADWQHISGARTGITQTATNKNGNFNEKIIFNMPIEATFKSTSPFGWPQLLLSIYGKNRWGTESLIGYCRAHMPVYSSTESAGSVITAPILIPKPTSMLSDIVKWVVCRNVELKNPKILLDNTKSKGLCVESYGILELHLSNIVQGTNKLGYDFI